MRSIMSWKTRLPLRTLERRVLKDLALASESLSPLFAFFSCSSWCVRSV